MSDDLNNNQVDIKPKRGGKRVGAGRKTGSTNKIQGGEFLEEAIFSYHTSITLEFPKIKYF